MNIATQRLIGKTSAPVTQMGMGGTAYANMYSAVSEQTAGETIQAAYRAGIRYFDTAPLYGRGLSETRLGAGLARLPRETLVISTKVGYALDPQPADAIPRDLFQNPLPFATRFDYSREGVLRSLEGSLRRLRTDRIDIVLIHDPDESVSNQLNFDPYGTSHFAEVMAGAYPALAAS